MRCVKIEFKFWMYNSQFVFNLKTSVHVMTLNPPNFANKSNSCAGI